MPTITVETLNFDFDEGWLVSKYDDWSYFRRRFHKVREGVKAIDLLAIDRDRTTWMIEVKDYRTHPRTKPGSLAAEVAHKVFDTLAALLPANINGDVHEETLIAKAALGAQKLRIVLHLEQPAKHSKLFPRAIDPAHVLMQLRQFVKSIDAHPLVVEMNRLGSVAWRVADATGAGS